MEKKLDIRKVDAALKRAARNAVSGPPQARAGRIIKSKIAAGDNTPTGSQPGQTSKASEPT